MTDITEATQRLKAIEQSPLMTITEFDGDVRTLGKKGVSLPWRVFRDLRLLAHAWIAEHDPSPVDDAWLTTNGFIQSELFGGDRGIWILSARDRDGDDFDVCWNAGKSVAELWVGSRVMIIPATTRGQITKLINGLKGT